MFSTTRLCALAALASAVFAAPATPESVNADLFADACPVIFDGRVNLLAKASDFDKNTSVYNQKYDLGQNLTWADVLKFPVVLPSVFDLKKLTKAFEVTINDKSIFYPGGNPQFGFRRAELMPAIDGNGNASDVSGVTTFHWSMRTDPTRPLNYTHEYHPVWHEYADYSSSQFTITLGTPFDEGKDPNVKEPKSIRVAGLQALYPEVTFFETPFTDNVWHNFALTLDWVQNTITVYYSQGYTSLKKVAKGSNNNAGGGAFHVGLLKLPTGPLGIDVVHEGYQPSNINEGVIFGGVFIEDSSKGCVTKGLL